MLCMRVARLESQEDALVIRLLDTLKPEWYPWKGRRWHIFFCIFAFKYLFIFGIEKQMSLDIQHAGVVVQCVAEK